MKAKGFMFGSTERKYPLDTEWRRLQVHPDQTGWKAKARRATAARRPAANDSPGVPTTLSFWLSVLLGVVLAFGWALMHSGHHPDRAGVVDSQAWFNLIGAAIGGGLIGAVLYVHRGLLLVVGVVAVLRLVY